MFLDVGRKHETLVSEIKDFISQGKSSRMSISIFVSDTLVPKSHRDDIRRPICLYRKLVVLQERNPELRGPQTFLMGSRHACHVLQKETLSLPSKENHNTSLKKQSRKKGQSVSLFLRHTEPWETHEISSPNKVSKAKTRTYGYIRLYLNLMIE